MTPTHTDSGWTAEIEYRRHLRSEYAEVDKNNNPYVAAPDPNRAEHFNPYGAHADYANEDELRDIDGVNVYNDRIIIPRETAKQLRDQPSENYDDALYERIVSVLQQMRISAGTDSHGDYWSRHSRGYHDESAKARTPTQTDPRPVYVQVPKGDPLNKLHQLYERRKRDGRTLLVIVIARDAATGTGKTTLACQLATDWDTHGWTADRATLDPGTYADKYTSEDTPKKSVLLLDEAEQAADNRRSMSGQNVKLSHLWATMRFREIYSIITLPSASMLDKRLKELADVKIVVHNRGTAVAYKTKIDDHDGSYRAKRLCRLRWEPMDDNPEYQRLTEKKAERMSNYAETFAYGDNDDNDTPDPKQAKRDYRRQVIERMSSGGWTQQEIADALPDITDRSTVSKILNGNY